MTPHSQPGQDASVAVLQQQQTSLDNAFRDLTRTVNEGFAAMTSKMDRINELTTTMVAITTRQEAHSDGLQRAFAEIQATNHRLAQALEENTNWRDQYATTIDHRFDAARAQLDDHKANNAKDHGEVKAEIATWRGMVKGGAVVLAMMLSLLGWLGGRYITQTESNTQTAQDLQRQIDAMPYPVNRKQVAEP